MDGNLSRRRKFSLAANALLLYTLPAAAGVLNDHDNGPLTGIFGMPDSTEGSRLLPPGTLAWALNYGVASHSIDETDGDERLYLDGETSRLAIRLRYAPSERLEVGIELPLLQHDGGYLDSLIDGWHDFFNLPQGKRPFREQDVLEFTYVGSAGDAVGLLDSARGFGDARIFGGWRWSDDGHNAVALRFGVKFPTGDARRLLGSGGTDISIGLAGDIDTLLGSNRWSAFYRLGAVRIGEPEYLADRYRSWAGHVSLGAGFRMTDSIELRAQAGLRSPLYDSEIHHLGSASTVLTFGGNIRLSEHYRLSIAVGEDVDVSTAPDVSFLLGLHYDGRRD